MTKRIILVIGISGAFIIFTTGCGNTFRGMGRDMEILGQRMQKNQTTTTPSTGNSQQDYNYYR